MKHLWLQEFDIFTTSNLVNNSGGTTFAHHSTIMFHLLL